MTPSPNRTAHVSSASGSPSSTLADLCRGLQLRPGLLLTGVGLGLAGMAVGAFVTARGARRTGELSLDVWVSQHRDRALVMLGEVVQTVFGPVVAPLILLAVCATLWVLRHRLAAFVVGMLTIPGWFSVELGKMLFARARPPAGLVQALVHETKPDSFPSGHVAFAAALVTALAVAFQRSTRVRTWVYSVGVPVVVVVAGSRLVVGAHYFGDVLAAPLFAAGTILVLASVGWLVPAPLAVLRRAPGTPT